MIIIICTREIYHLCHQQVRVLLLNNNSSQLNQ